MSAEALVHLAGLLFTIFCSCAGVWWATERHIRKVEDKVGEVRLMLAEKYATVSIVEALEKRLTDRLDTVTAQLVALPDATVDRLTKYLHLKEL